MLRTITKTMPVAALLATAIACDSGADLPVAAAIELSADVDVLPTGQTTNLDVVVRDANGNPITNPGVSFESSSQSVATVSSAGVVTGVADGVVTITATAGTVSDAVSIAIVEMGNPCETALAIQVGEPVRASLQPGDCEEITNDGSFVDLWFFDLAQPASVTIRMTSDEFNTYLWLVDDQGVDVGEDDDSGGGTDAEIRADLAAGTYFILANNWPADAWGAYTLSVTTSTTTTTADPALRASGSERVRQIPDLRLRKH